MYFINLLGNFKNMFFKMYFYNYFSRAMYITHVYFKWELDCVTINFITLRVKCILNFYGEIIVEQTF